MKSVLRDIRTRGNAWTSVVPASLWFTVARGPLVAPAATADSIASAVFTEIVWPEHDADIAIGRGLPA